MVLKLEEVRRKVADFVLTADFELARGERAALIGKSGMGKSTLLRMIAGLEPLDSGKILMGDRDITHWTAQKRRIGFVFQEAALFPSLSVLGNAIFGLLQHGVSRREAEAQGLQWLEKVGLAQRAHSPITHLSGGEAQRVAFIRALIWKPELVLLDEPFSALDPERRHELRTELLRLHEHWPVPLLLVSHDAQDLETVANVRLEIQSISSELANSERKVIRTDRSLA